MLTTRRTSLLAIMSTLALGRNAASAVEPATQLNGRLEMQSITSKRNGSTYPLFVYLPPGAAADPAGRRLLPVVLMLDAESRFRTMVDIAELNAANVIVVGIGNEANRSHDYVPANTCTEDGGGEAAFFDFVRFELVPFVEAQVGGDPKQRALQGHSHGGSFALYAMFNEAPGLHHFSAYLAADPSVRCIGQPAYQWDRDYAARHRDLPVRLHLSYANKANEPFVKQIEDHHYAGLTMVSKWYPGGHNGMVQAAFTDALKFAFAAA